MKRKGIITGGEKGFLKANPKKCEQVLLPEMIYLLLYQWSLCSICGQVKSRTITVPMVMFHRSTTLENTTNLPNSSLLKDEL